MLIRFHYLLDIVAMEVSFDMLALIWMSKGIDRSFVMKLLA